MLHKATKDTLRASLLTVAISIAGCGGSEERQEKHLQKAQDFFQAENYEMAKAEIKVAMEANPSSIEGFYWLGELAEKEKDYRAAYNYYSEVIKLAPAHIKALNKLASFHLLSKDIEGAIEKANKVLSLDPKNADALAVMAGVYFRNEETDLAAQKAQEALAIEPGNIAATAILTAIYTKDSPDLALNIIAKGIENQDKHAALKMLKIRVLHSQQKNDEVVAVYRELMADDPENLLYPYQLANFYLQDFSKKETTRKDMAEAVLRDQVAQKPDNDTVKLWLVEFLAKNREVDVGKKLLIDFVQVSPENFALRDALGKLYMQAQEPVQAKAVYQESIDSNPESSDAIEARIRLIEIAAFENDQNKVKVLIDEIFKLEPENSFALLTRARIKLANNQFKEAIQDLRVVLKNDADSLEALALLARAHEAEGATNLALDEYKELIEKDANNLAGLVGFARLQVQREEFEKSTEALEKALEFHPGNAEATRLLVGIYIKDQRWDDALSISAKLTEKEGTMALGYYLQGRTYLLQKSFKPAVDVLKKSLEINPTIIESLQALAGAYLSLEQSNQAISYVQKHVDRYPEHIHAKELLANLLASSGNIKKAIAIMEGVINDYPAQLSAYRLLAKLYSVKNRIDDIEPILKSGVKKAKGKQDLSLLLAEFYQSKNKPDQAKKIYEELLLNDPESMVVRNNLAVLLMDHYASEESFKRAADLVTVLEGTENPAFLDTAGWVQYQLGNYLQAVSLLQAAVEKGGNSGVYHYHLGMAYYKSDMKERAKESLQQAVSNERDQYLGRDKAEQVLSEL